MREEINFQEAPSCAVGRSSIQGQGLYALKNFKKGEIVADYSNSSEQWKLCKFTAIPKKYRETCWWIGETLESALLASPESAFMRANHSRTPNTTWMPNQKKLLANRLIKCGEEITYDYRLEIAPAHIKSKPPKWA
jgi:SET domain-containing protein